MKAAPITKSGSWLIVSRRTEQNRAARAEESVLCFVLDLRLNLSFLPLKCPFEAPSSVAGKRVLFGKLYDPARTEQRKTVSNSHQAQ